MSSIVISGDTSGAITLSAPAVAGSNTITLPAATGTVMVSGNMPAFSAYASASQTLANTVFTKIQLNVEEFDTANAFDSTTNYRFTPLVAGYYQINGLVSVGGTTGINYIASIYKNGSEYKRGNQLGPNPAGTNGVCVCSLLYLNGSTDYVELYGYQGSTISQSTSSGSSLIYFNGSLVRGA